MNKKVRKWSLWMCGILATFCLGLFGVNTLLTQNAPVTASAATTYTVDAIRSEPDSTAVHLYITPADGDGTSFGEGNWDAIFSFQSGTGTGLTRNGELLATKDIKQPGAFFINLGFSAVEGDVVILDGTWAGVIGSLEKQITFNNASLRFNGSTWETCTAVSFGSVTASGDANSLTLTSGEKVTSGKSLQVVSGGVFVNGDNANGRIQSIKTTANGITLEATMEDAIADVVFICGLFTDGSTYYAVSDSYFMWEGTQWRTLAGYDGIIDKAIPITADAQLVQRASGFYLPIKTNTGLRDWAENKNLAPIVNGHGLKLNGAPLSNGTIKFYENTVYVSLDTDANVGDVLTINGLFQHADGWKVLFAPTQALTWNGSTWEHLSYTTYDFDALVVHSSSSQAGSATTTNSSLYMTRADGGWIPVDSWSDEFTYESGANVKKNGLDINYTMKSVDGSLVLEFDGVATGDIILVDGTFVCESQQTRYVIKESCFKWNGAAWEVTDPHYTQKIENVAQSNIKMDDPNFYLILPTRLVFVDWQAFTLQSGNGISVNNKKLADAIIQATGDSVYVSLRYTPEIGDLLMIAGSFTLKINGTTEEIIFETPLAFEYDGSKWVVSTKALYDLGTMTISTTSSTTGGPGTRADHLYLNSTNYTSLPVGSWDPDGMFTFEKGDGLMVNGQQKTIYEIKSIGSELWMRFDSVQNGDVVTLSGTFVNTIYNVRYVIPESKFIWLDGIWYDDYTTQTVSGVFSTKDSNAGAVYLACTGNGEIFSVTDGSWNEKLTFIAGSGVGVTLGGTQIVMDDIKIPGTMYVSLKTAANVGDILVIGGKFYNKTLKVVYTIPETKFVWLNGAWNTCNHIEETGKLASVASSGDTIVYLSKANGEGFATAGSWDEKLAFVEGTGCGVVYKGEKLGSPDMSRPKEFCIVLPSAANVGDTLKIGGKFYSSFSNLYIIEETTLVWMGSVWMDNDDVVSVSYGERVEYVEKNGTIALADLDMGSAFIGWASGNMVYTAGSVFTVGTESVTLTAVSVDFVLKYGASIRLASTANESGIRFTGMMNTADIAALAQYGVTVKEFGILIMPNDKLATNQAPNLTDFTAGSTVLKIKNNGYTENIGEYTTYYGAMVKVKMQNYARNFAGRGYMVVVVNGEEMLLYTPFNSDNVRSVRTIAQAFRDDTSTPTQEGELRYGELSDERKTIVDTYADSADYQAVNPAKAAQAKMQEGYAAAYVVNAYGKEDQVSSATRRKE